MESAIVVGAGLVGSLLSIYLAKAGYKVDVYERNPDVRNVSVDRGRSINITLCERGFRALDRVGAGDEVRKLCVPCYGRVIHTQDGTLSYLAYGNNNEAIYSIGRHCLNKSLVEFSRRIQNIDFHFDRYCVDIDLDNGRLVFNETNRGCNIVVKGSRIFAADGAYSVIRQHMQRLKQFNYSQEYCGHGYREFITPTLEQSEPALKRNAIHIWPRDEFMLIGFPNLDHTFTLTLHLPFYGAISHASISTAAEMRKLFQDYFPDALPLVEGCLGDVVGGPIGTMVTIKSSPWRYLDKVVLIGDACHAIFPSYGQGANAGFEDCQVLAKCIERHSGDWFKIFDEYEVARKGNLDIMATLCYEHFNFLRKDVGTQEFVIRDKVEKMVQELYQDVRSLYYNISFTNRSYSESAEIAQENDRIVNAIMGVRGPTAWRASEEARGAIATGE